jgi:hypothetical protein
MTLSTVVPQQHVANAEAELADARRNAQEEQLARAEEGLPPNPNAYWQKRYTALKRYVDELRTIRPKPDRRKPVRRDVATVSRRSAPRRRGAGRPKVKGSSRRSTAKSGSSGDDPEPEPEDVEAESSSRPAGRLCRACEHVITHSARAKYCDRQVCRRARSTKRQAESRARKADKTPKRCAGCGCFLSAHKGDAPGLCVKASLCWPCQGYGDNGDDTRTSGGWPNPTLQLVLNRWGKWSGRLNSGAGLAVAA